MDNSLTDFPYEKLPQQRCRVIYLALIFLGIITPFFTIWAFKHGAGAYFLLGHLAAAGMLSFLRCRASALGNKPYLYHPCVDFVGLITVLFVWPNALASAYFYSLDQAEVRRLLEDYPFKLLEIFVPAFLDGQFRQSKGIDGGDLIGTRFEIYSNILAFYALLTRLPEMVTWSTRRLAGSEHRDRDVGLPFLSGFLCLILFTVVVFSPGDPHFTGRGSFLQFVGHLAWPAAAMLVLVTIISYINFRIQYRQVPEEPDA